MNLQNTLTFSSSAVRSARYYLTGRIRFPRERLGDVLEMPDGDTFIVYRETVLQPAAQDAPQPGVVLVFAMQVPDRTAGTTLRGVLFDPLANVATPFFAGMPGFRRKLWLAGEFPGEFLELYEWAGAEDAERFVTVLRSILDPFDFAGSVSFEVVTEDSIDEYVDARSISWRDEVAREGGRGRRRRSVGIGLIVVFVVFIVFVTSYLAKNRRSRAG